MTRRIYPSSNQYGIPTLELQPSATRPGVPDPVVVWGSVARTTTMRGMWLYYTDDRRFARLWDDPDQPVRTGCSEIVEPNYSVTECTTLAEGIWQTYRKRWLARYWQEQGLAVWVDMYCHGQLSPLLGVPVGWQRYATVGSDRALDDLREASIEAALHAQGAPYTLLVYGGGRLVREWCAGRPEVVHVPSRTAGQVRPGEGTRRKNRLAGQA